MLLRGLVAYGWVAEGMGSPFVVEWQRLWLVLKCMLGLCDVWSTIQWALHKGGTAAGGLCQYSLVSFAKELAVYLLVPAPLPRFRQESKSFRTHGLGFRVALVGSRRSSLPSWK